MRNRSDTFTIWDSRKGFHVAYPFHWRAYDEEAGVWKEGDSDGFEDLSTKIDKTLRVYFGGGFGGAAGGITYTSNVVFELNYE